MGNGKRGLYEIRYKVVDGGKNGGLGPVKSFRATLSSPKQASKKLRARAVIISVVRAR